MLGSGLFISPHAADDSVGEWVFVGSSCFVLGLALGPFAVEVVTGLWQVTLLSDRSDVEHAVDPAVTPEVEPVAAATIKGRGGDGYRLAVEQVARLLEQA